MGKLGSSPTNTLRRKRRKEVKRTPEAVERCGVEPGRKLMDRHQARQRRISTARSEVQRVNHGRLTNHQVEEFAKVFATEELSYQYFEEGNYRSAASLLREQGHPALADLLKQKFM